MQSRHSSIQFAASLLLACAAAAMSQGLDIEGTLIGQDNVLDEWLFGGRNIVALNSSAASPTPRTLIDNTKLPGLGGSAHPSFSPDGKQICFFAKVNNVTGIYTANNDGSAIQKLCSMKYGNMGNSRLNWCTNGYIYWSEYTAEIFRVNVTTRAMETYWANVPAAGYDGTRVEALSVSLDGTRGISHAHGMTNILDLVNKTRIGTCPGGCHGMVSSDGQSIIMAQTCCIASPPGAGGAASSSWINRFISTIGSDQADHTGYVLAPNVSSGGCFYERRSCANNADFYVSFGQGAPNSCRPILCRISTKETKFMGPKGICPGDYWHGALPSASTTPVIALDSSQLSFSAPSGNPAAKSVKVSNIGGGTLTAVTATESASWLSVAVSGSGNSQTLTNSVSVAGLRDSSYQATVTVSGGGASNTATYLVRLSVGAVPAAPSGLTAAATATAASGSVALQWTDNATNETSYLIERKSGAGAWAARATAAANATTFTDTGLSAGDYTYRVSAKNGAGTSAASNEASALIKLQASIAVTSPADGATIAAGSTVTVKWTAANVSGVIVEYSFDDGVTWIKAAGINGSIGVNDATWGNFPWIVPAGEGASVFLRVVSYTDRSVLSAVGPLAVTPLSVMNGRADFRRMVGLTSNSPSVSLVYARGAGAAPGSDARLCVYRLNGSRVMRTGPGNAGSPGSALGQGRYAARVEKVTRR